MSTRHFSLSYRKLSSDLWDLEKKMKDLRKLGETMVRDRVGFQSSATSALAAADTKVKMMDL